MLIKKGVVSMLPKNFRVTSSKLDPETLTQLAIGAEKKGYSSIGEYVSYILKTYLDNEMYFEKYQDVISSDFERSLTPVYQELKLQSDNISKLINLLAGDE